MTLNDVKILVTGANGFLGGRLVEFLALGYRADVRALVRDARRSVRLCRLPIEIVVGDVRDSGSVQRAIEGCSIVVHCASAIDANRARSSSTFAGTEIVARAAQQQLARLVHISSAAVYGSPGDVDVNEDCPMKERWKGDVYGAAKIAGEEIITNSYSEGLAATIIQPTIIYGPYSAEWSVGPLNMLRRGNYVVPTTGLCNPVYVDDVVHGIILAATNLTAIGKRYIISGRDTVSWSEFYGYYARLGTEGQVVSAGEDEYRSSGNQESAKPLTEVLRAIARSSEVRSVAKDNRVVNGLYALAQQLIPERKFRQMKQSVLQKASGARPGAVDGNRPNIWPGPALWKLYKNESRYSIDKAMNEIGYKPQTSLEHGMRLTGEWAQWARLI
jgi:nucleoside-diphosphate-sugar epimerase